MVAFLSPLFIVRRRDDFYDGYTKDGFWLNETTIKQARITIHGEFALTDENVDNLPGHRDVLRMATNIAAAYVARNTVANSQIPGIITRVYDTLAGISAGTAEKFLNSDKPAVAIRRSITPEFIICLEDGRKMKMLKRHLRTAYNLSPEEYRSRWGLPPEYPTVAPN